MSENMFRRCSSQPVICRVGIPADQFTPEVVGGKSCNLNSLRGRLGRLDSSADLLAFPFGTLETVLQAPGKRSCARSMHRSSRPPSRTQRRC